MRTIIIAILISAVLGEVSQCLEDLLQIGKHMMNFTGTDPHIRMAQYTGRKLNDLGDYKSCITLDYAEYILIRLDPEISLFFAICSPKNCTLEDYQEIISNLAPPQTFLHNAISTSQISPLAGNSLWFKSTKDTSDLRIITVDSGNDIQIFYPKTEIEDKFEELTAGATLMLVICIFMMLVLAAGTVLDLIHQNQQKSAEKRMEESSEESGYLLKTEIYTPTSIYIQVLMSFSLYSNTKNLFFHRNASSGQREALDIFNGIRVMSMAWVVLGHVFAMRMKFSAILNLDVVIEWLREPKGLLIYGAFYSVDTFFWISGFLMAYLFLSEYNAKGKMNFKQIYFHRLYRIIPPYMYSFCATYAFARYLGNGPMYYNGDFMDKDCDGVWWSNLLFINNFVPNGDGNKCFIHSWYLANDMQFFIISPLILHVYHKISRKIGWGLVFTVIFSNIIITASIADYHGASVGGINSLWESFETIYTKPYCRIGAYIMGIVFGMIYFSYKHYKQTSEVYDPYALYITDLLNTRVFRYISYTLGVLLIRYIMYIQYYAYHTSVENPDMTDSLTQTQRNSYLAMSRIGYGLGIGLVLLPIMIGHGTPVYKVLAAQFWTPFAKLSFCGYLIHMPIFFVIFMGEATGIFYDNTKLMMDFLACLTLTWIGAYVLSMTIEAPSMVIEKMMKTAALAKKKALNTEGIELS